MSYSLYLRTVEICLRTSGDIYVVQFLLKNGRNVS